MFESSQAYRVEWMLNDSLAWVAQVLAGELGQYCRDHDIPAYALDEYEPLRFTAWMYHLLIQNMGFAEDEQRRLAQLEADIAGRLGDTFRYYDEAFFRSKFASFRQGQQDFDVHLTEAFGRRLFRPFDASKEAVARDPAFRAVIARMQQIVSHLLLTATQEDWQPEF